MIKSTQSSYSKLIFIIIFAILTFSQIALTQAADSSRNAKIIGGTETNIADWPWMVALVNPGFNIFNNQFCGGTLISDRWVLTAAHCVIDETTDSVQILTGKTKLSSGRERELISVSQIIIHPDYDQISFDSDLALLKLSETVTAEPIQTLGHYSLSDSPETTATAIGWGNSSTQFDFFPDALREVDLPLISNDLCAENIADITENMLCAGFATGTKDTCVGDSGGPLMVFDRPSRTWIQVGVTSFGVGCTVGTVGGFGGYTRVKEFSDFISDTICSNSERPDAPTMTVTVTGNDVTISWTDTTRSGGYRLNYAPFPSASPIQSIDMQSSNDLAISMPSGSAFFVAINAYEGNCRSEFSNIASFSVN